MIFQLGGVRLILGVLLSFVVGQARADGFRFFAGGDAPYSDFGKVLLSGLLDRISQEAPPFVIHVGDIKSGSALCTDAALEEIAGLFRRQPYPVVYTPGDNEWTDCYREKAGGYDPQQRLAKLRLLFFADPQVLRLSQLKINIPNLAYPENYWFLYEGVLFVTLHMVGSYNNRFPRRPDAMVEFRARDRANRAMIRTAFEQARRQKALGVVLIFHANPSFEREKPRKPYKQFLSSLQHQLKRWERPVLAIHGDTHTYTLDHPLRRPGLQQLFPNFSRLEVSGAPNVSFIEVKVDPKDPALFHIQPFEAD